MVVASLLIIAFYRINSGTQSEFRLLVVFASGSFVRENRQDS